jgi:hypothetical protein
VMCRVRRCRGSPGRPRSGCGGLRGTFIVAPA